MKLLCHGKFYTATPSWVHIARQLNEYELMIVDQGTLYIGNEIQEYIVHEKEYLIMAPTAYQHGTRPGACSFHWFHFEHSGSLPCPKSGTLQNDSLLLSIINALYQSERLNHTAVSGHLFHAILAELSCSRQEPNAPKQPIRERVDEYLKYSQENIHQVQKLADSFGYHEKYLSQLFYRETGIHLKQYLMDHIMERGKEFLLSTDLSITQISVECGFSEPHNFSRAIRKTYGMSPSQLRRNFRQH